MHTILVIVGGLALLAVTLLLGRFVGHQGAAGLVFLPIWLVIAALNLWLGTKRGYSVAEELPIFVIVFAIPAAAAMLAWWKQR